ncbi:fimbria/pilus outer membrane usher protein, partial [Proteus mirabilis]|nr:fimbria/pilus outer membrane usher protein [Proteus mirabilis]
RIQLNITQKIGDQSTLYIIGTNQRYWNSKKQDNQLQIGQFNFLVTFILLSK